MKKIGSRIIMTGLTALVVTGCSETEPFASQRESSWTKADPKGLTSATPEDPAEILPKTHFAAGKMFEAQGSLGKAIVQYQKTLEMKPEHLGALNRLGMIYARTQRHAEAENILKRAVRLAPQSAQVRNNLGFGYLLAKRWSDAETEFQNALSIMPEFERARINLGIAYCRQQRFDEALLAFRNVVPEADAFYNLGLMFRNEQRFQDAGRAFKRAIQMNPSFLAAKQQLAQIGPRLRRPDNDELAMSDGQWQALVGAQPAPVHGFERVLQGYAETPPQSYEPQPQAVATQQDDSQPQTTASSSAPTASVNQPNFSQPTPSQTQPVAQNDDRQQPENQIRQQPKQSVFSQQQELHQPTKVSDRSRQNDRMPAHEPTTPAESRQTNAKASRISASPQAPAATQSTHREPPTTMTEMQPIDEQRSVPAEVRTYEKSRTGAKLANKQKPSTQPAESMPPIEAMQSSDQSPRGANVAMTGDGLTANSHKSRSAANSQTPNAQPKVAANRSVQETSSASATGATAHPMDIVSEMVLIDEPQPPARTASHQTTGKQAHPPTSPSTPVNPPRPKSDAPGSPNATRMTVMEPMTPIPGDTKKDAPKESKAKAKKSKAKAKKRDAQSDDVEEMELMDPVDE